MLAMSSDETDTPPQPARGRPFAPGNPGRKPGSRNKLSLLAEAMLDEDAAEIMRIAIGLAKAGDSQILKLFVERLLPKQRAIELNLPELKRAADCADALAAVVEAVAAGEISPSQAAAIGTLLESYTRALHASDLEKRIEVIEEALEQSK
jgi:hypothetical protein